MKMALEKDGYKVIESSDGISASEAIKMKKPALVFLDINMPKVNGIQVLEEINQLENPPMIVIVTAYGSERVAVDAMKKGAYDYIAKEQLRNYEAIEKDVDEAIVGLASTDCGNDNVFM